MISRLKLGPKDRPYNRKWVGCFSVIPPTVKEISYHKLDGLSDILVIGNEVFFAQEGVGNPRDLVENVGDSYDTVSDTT